MGSSYNEILIPMELPSQTSTSTKAKGQVPCAGPGPFFSK